MEVFGVIIPEEKLDKARVEHERYMSDLAADKLEFVRTLSTLIWPDVEDSLRRAYDPDLSLDERTLNAWTYVTWNFIFKMDIEYKYLDHKYLMGLIYTDPRLVLIWYTLFHTNVDKDVLKILQGSSQLEQYVRCCIAFKIEEENTQDTKNPTKQ